MERGIHYVSNPGDALAEHLNWNNPVFVKVWLGYWMMLEVKWFLCKLAQFVGFLNAQAKRNRLDCKLLSKIEVKISPNLNRFLQI